HFINSSDPQGTAFHNKGSFRISLKVPNFTKGTRTENPTTTDNGLSPTPISISSN
ncbi:16341_t:CDS:2, partial [Gigaspora rosea]